jgi:2-haloacid dehalogenase
MDNDLKQAKALLFDYFGTVVDWLTPICEALADNAPAGSNVNWNEFAQKWRDSFFTYVAKLGDGPMVAFEEVQRQCLLESSSNNQWGWSDAQINALVESWTRVTPWEDSVAGLQKLRDKYIW